MAEILFPTSPTEGQELIAANGRKLKFTSGVWKAIVQFTGGASGGGDGGLSEEAVTLIASTVADAAVTALGITPTTVLDTANARAAAAITALNLGTMATADMIVSSAAPDDAVGKNGDIWMQTA